MIQAMVYTQMGLFEDPEPTPPGLPERARAVFTENQIDRANRGLHPLGANYLMGTFDCGSCGRYLPAKSAGARLHRLHIRDDEVGKCCGTETGTFRVMPACEYWWPKQVGRSWWNSFWPEAVKFSASQDGKDMASLPETLLY